MSDKMSDEPFDRCENIAEMGNYKKEALKVVNFRLIYDEEDVNNSNSIIATFKPEMAHQIFGDSESIFGYRSVSITLNYTHNSSQCYVDIETSGKIANSNLKCDDILKSLDPFLPNGYTCCHNEFLDMLKMENHEHIYGDIINELEDTGTMNKFPKHNVKATYKITKNQAGVANFKKFHERFETFIIWYIDAANFIDMNDKRWTFFYVYEEFKHPENNKIYRTPIGFCSVYNFYAYPNSIRPRISQFLILPPYQRKGIGTFLYQTIVNEFRATQRVIDFTVEEPTVSFQKIRDLSDCQLIHNNLTNAEINFFTTSSRVIFNMAKKMKIGNKQSQRIYDILGLYYAAESSLHFKKKCLDSIKERMAKCAEESKTHKRLCNSKRIGMNGGGGLDIDSNGRIEALYKRYLEDIEPSVEYLQKKLKK